MAGLLKDALNAASGRKTAELGHQQTLSIAIRVYSSALELHSQCTANRPQVVPLAGQSRESSAWLTPDTEGRDTDGGLGYFAAVELPEQSLPELAKRLALLKSTGKISRWLSRTRALFHSLSAFMLIWSSHAAVEPS